MRVRRTEWMLVAAAALAMVGTGCASTKTSTREVPVDVSGGHATDTVDHGRPVVLVASALGVPPEVFRDAFSRVSPASAGTDPEPAQVDRNKAALLATLGPYGVTNDALDRASNYYRYSSSAGELWPTSPLKAHAVISDGKPVSVVIDDAGAGYTSSPTVTVPGFPNVKIVATLSYGRDVLSNGGVAALTLVP